MYSREFLNKVKGATNLIELAAEYGVALKKAGNGLWVGRCPHPSHNDSTPSFRVWENKLLPEIGLAPYNHSFACMGCHSGKKDKQDGNYGSDCFAFVQWLSDGKISWPQAVEILAKRVGISLPTDKNSKLYNHNRRFAERCHENLTDDVRRYLYSRGITDAAITNWLIGFDGERVVFPLFDRYCRVVGFSRRLVGDAVGDEPKYVNSATSSIFSKRSYFYGIHKVSDDCNELRIAEGCIDVVLASESGVANVVATLGTGFTKEHVDLIKVLNKTPVLCYDADERGLAAVQKAIQMLSANGIYSKVLLLPSGQDLADFVRYYADDIEQYIQTYSMPYWQFQLNDLAAIFEAKINDLRLKVMPSINAVASSIVNPNELVVFKSYVKTKFCIDLL